MKDTEYNSKYQNGIEWHVQINQELWVGSHGWSIRRHHDLTNHVNVQYYLTYTISWNTGGLSSHFETGSCLFFWEELYFGTDYCFPFCDISSRMWDFCMERKVFSKSLCLLSFTYIVYFILNVSGFFFFISIWFGLVVYLEAL